MCRERKGRYNLILRSLTILLFCFSLIHISRISSASIHNFACQRTFVQAALASTRLLCILTIPIQPITIMLSTKSTVSLAFTVSFLTSAAAAPPTNSPVLHRMASQSNFGDRPADDNQKYFAEALCTPYQKFVEEVAWRDALQYAQALARWQPNSSFQPAMDLYMGNDSRGQLSTTLRGRAGES